MTVDPYQQHLRDLDESLDAEGYLPLYTFSWWLRGQRRGLTEDEIAALCERAYDEVTSRRRLRLEWFDLETDDDVNSGRRAAPGTPLNFDINTRGEIDSPYLALVPDQPTS